MTQPTVPETADIVAASSNGRLNAAIAEPDPWAVLAAELTNIATDLAALAGSGLPVPRHVSLDMLTGDSVDGDGDDETIVRVTDAVGQILLDRDGSANKMSGGTHHYSAKGSRGWVKVVLFNEVSEAWVERQQHDAEARERDAKIRRLEAEIHMLRTAAASTKPVDEAGLGFSREPDATEVPPVEAGIEGGPHGHAPGRHTPVRISDETIAEAAAMEARDRVAGGPPWEVPEHPDNNLPGGWHHGQLTGNPVAGYAPEGRTIADVQSERSVRDLARYAKTTEQERPAREHWESVLDATEAAKTSPAGGHSHAAHAEAMPVLHQQALDEDAERPPTCRAPVGDGYQRCDEPIQLTPEGHWVHTNWVGPFDHNAVGDKVFVETGPTCLAEVDGRVCGLAIRPGFSRAWVHAASIQNHDAVGPDQT